MSEIHGANIFKYSKLYNFELKDIRDFSSNINPLGPSKKAITYLKDNLDLIKTYPDTEYYDLKNSIMEYLKFKTDFIYLGTGTTEIIMEYIKYINPKKALLLSPCYSEYEREIKKYTDDIFFYYLKEEFNFNINIDEIINIIKMNDIDLFVFANPNNPTGTIFQKEDVEKLLKETNIKLLVDETYIEFTDIDVFSSFFLTEKYDNILVCRSTSKFFATPGIRLGYALCKDERFFKYYKKLEMIWNINIFAVLMGEVMFRDNDYIINIYNYITFERKRVMENLMKIKELKAFNSYGNFILCKILNNKNANELQDYLLKKASIIRNCETFKNLNNKFFRFCLLNKEDNEELVNDIAKFLKKNKI